MNKIAYFLRGCIFLIRVNILFLRAFLDAVRSGHRTVMVSNTECRFAVDSLDVTWELRFVHEFEKPFYRAILEEIDEGVVFYDIGANIGFYTVLTGSQGARVVSFEPHPEARDLLMRNIELNDIPDARTYPIGLSDTSGEAGLTNSVTSGRAKIDPDGEGINLDTLDHRVEQNSLKMPDVVKIDVEGHEENVLRGMETVLAANPVLFIEVHGSDRMVRTVLEEHGYSWEPIMHRPDGNILGRADPIRTRKAGDAPS